MPRLPKKDIRLLLDAQVRAKRKRKAVHYIKLLLYFIILAGTANLAFYSLRLGQLTHANNVAKREIERLAPIRELDDEVQFKMSFVANRSNFGTQLIRNDRNIIAYIERLERVIPTEFSVSNISINADGEVTIQGSIDNEVKAADVMVTLRESGLLANAQLASFNMQAGGTTDVQIVGTQSGF
jgi:Tfp pilus assembly protein PilN